MIAWLLGCGGAPELRFVESPADRKDERLPLVVALHGFGGEPEPLLALVESCGLPVRVVAPRGPRKHPSGEGAAWYLLTDNGARDIGDVLNAADQVARFVQTYTSGRPTTKVVVTGFSQGGILSFALATRYPELVDLSIPVSGAVLEVVPAKAGGPPIRALHGERDELLAASETEARVAALKEAGWDATIRVFPGVGHTIAEEMRAALCAELAGLTR